MSDKLDYKKEYKDLYMPRNKPTIIDVPSINFIMVDGKGNPHDREYQDAMSLLYTLAFTIKMSKMSGNQPEGYFEYVVPPLEGLWWCEGESFNFNRRDSWRWTSMIRQPEFVNQQVFEWAMNEGRKKKPDLDFSKVRFETLTEGLCVQMMHIGPYENEPASIKKMHLFMEENGLRDDSGPKRKHHEIYLSDPRRTAIERLKTVLRLPVSK